MPVIKHNPEGVFPPYRSYSHAVEIKGGASLLIISGLNGYLSDGATMPETFEEQGEIIWKHIGRYSPPPGWVMKISFRFERTLPTRRTTKPTSNCA